MAKLARPSAGLGLGALALVFSVPLFWLSLANGFALCPFLIASGAALLGLMSLGGMIINLRLNEAFSEVSLTPDGGPFPLGGVARMRLVLEPKRPIDLSQATIDFETIEKAEYSAGTDSRTYTEKLHEWHASIPLPRRLVGRIDHVIEIPIPRELPPTFTGKHNSMTSRCEVRVSLERVPDLHLREDVVLAAEYAG